MHWHPFEQEFWGLLNTRRDAVKHFGRIPAVIHTDHANISRLEALPLERVDAKHYRWLSELLQGGSLLLYRPGAGVMHKAPDGISRNPEGRDRLILARAVSCRSSEQELKESVSLSSRGISMMMSQKSWKLPRSHRSIWFL